MPSSHLNTYISGVANENIDRQFIGDLNRSQSYLIWRRCLAVIVNVVLQGAFSLVTHMVMSGIITNSSSGELKFQKNEFDSLLMNLAVLPDFVHFGHKIIIEQTIMNGKPFPET